MRRPRTSRLLPLLATAAVLVEAHPYPRDDLHDIAGFGFIMPRGCAQYCGYNNMYCCDSGQSCYTSEGMAGCSAGPGAANAGGGYSLYTTTWTQTQTFTSTMSSFFPVATYPPKDCVPVAGSGHIACGRICCQSWQTCASEKNSCLGDPPGTVIHTTYTTGGQVITTQFMPPYRPTSTGTGTGTGTGSQTGTAIGSTSTSSNDTVAAGGTGSSLSAGAIAGIVIGSLAGVALLLLICACCLVRGLWHGIMALLGLGKKKDDRSRRRSGDKTTTTIEEERYTRRGGSVHSRRDRHSGWFPGSGPSTAGTRRDDRKKKSDGGGLGWLGLAGAAGTILLLLGLRRDKKEKKRPPPRTRSSVSYSYSSDSYEPSSPSSGRTRNTRRTHRSEGTRHSRAPSRRP